MSSCCRPLSYFPALALIATLHWASGGDAALITDRPPITRTLPASGRIAPASVCYIVPGSPLRLASPVRRRPKVHRVHPVHAITRFAKPAGRHRPPVRSSRLQAAARVECTLFEPEPPLVEAFAETMARMGMPVATDEVAIQKLIQKHQRRSRRHRAAEPLISAAPEPASWLMMLGGFAAIGWTLRRQDRSAARSAAPVASR